MARLVRPWMIGAGLVAWSAACASFSAEDSVATPLPDGGADVGAPTLDAGDAGDAGVDVEVGSDASAVSGMVEITTDAGMRFAIDATEVTRAQFLAFRATHDAGGPFPKCPLKLALGPHADCAGTTDDAQPVTCVDWCDAKAYCASVGKRLCGKIGGGPFVRGTEADAAVDEWARACEGTVGSKWPYGGQAMDTACNTQAALRGGAVSVGSFPQCVGGEPRLFDMSGNVNEWEDSCFPSDDAGTTTSCLLRGGSFKHPVKESSCEYRVGFVIDSATDDIGIRCCKDL